MNAVAGISWENTELPTLTLCLEAVAFQAMVTTANKVTQQISYMGHS